MKYFYVIITVFALYSCKNSSNDSNSAYDTAFVDSLLTENSPVKDTARVFKIDSYLNNGFILPGQLQTFDDSLRRVKTIDIATMTHVMLLKFSIDKLSYPGTNDDCRKANYMEVQNGDDVFWAYGGDLFELDADLVTPFNWNSDEYDMFPINNFDVGASDSSGLTGCNDFSYITIHKIDNDNVWVIENPKERIATTGDDCRFAALMHTDGLNEQILSVTPVKDSLRIKIQYELQDGGGTYDFTVWKQDEKFVGRISNKSDQNIAQ